MAVTAALFRDDAYARACEAEVVAAGPGGIVLDRTVFYPRAGGQPGDAGRIVWEGGEAVVTEAVKAADGFAVLHQVAEGSALPHAGAVVRAELDWNRRFAHMRVHTAMHLLCSLIPGAGVTGGQIGPLKGRLDFDLPAAPDREAIEAGLASLIAADHPVSSEWISEDELDANPGLVRTLSVQPPRGMGRVRLVRIGDPAIDLQPCGGTHVRTTREIGIARVARIENKGKSNRRIALVLE
jgi:misacylated tRNA(Ala) deacylase